VKARIDLPPAQERQDRSLGELMSEMTKELGDLFRKEVELAKVEIKENAKRASRAGMMFGAAAVLGLEAIMLVALTIAWSLDAIVPTGIAFLIASMLFAGGAAVVFARGRKEAADLKPVPEQTAETLKEDVRWAKARLS